MFSCSTSSPVSLVLLDLWLSTGDKTLINWRLKKLVTKARAICSGTGVDGVADDDEDDDEDDDDEEEEEEEEEYYEDF